jgi:hypothetical protein
LSLNIYITQQILQILFELGHKVRNTTIAQHRTTKEPLNLFFVDFETAKNNKEIYNIKALENRIVQIEPPPVNQNNNIQCMR